MNQQSEEHASASTLRLTFDVPLVGAGAMNHSILPLGEIGIVQSSKHFVTLRANRNLH
jgi:hypothetical protein